MQASLFCKVTIGNNPRGVDVLPWISTGEGEISVDVLKQTASEENEDEKPSFLIAAACHENTCQILAIDRHVQTIIANLRLGKKLKAQFCQFSLARKLIAVAASNRSITLWDWQSQTRIAELLGHQDDIIGCKFYPFQNQGEILASFGVDGKVIIWSVPEGRSLCYLQHSCTVRDVSFTHCQDSASIRVVVGLIDAFVQVWNVRLGHNDVHETTSICKFKAFRSRLNSIAVSPSGHRLCISSVDGAFSVWNGLPLKLAQAKWAGFEVDSSQSEPIYVGMPDDCLHVADGGASALEECQREFEAALYEYRYDSRETISEDETLSSNDSSKSANQTLSNSMFNPKPWSSSKSVDSNQINWLDLKLRFSLQSVNLNMCFGKLSRKISDPSNAAYENEGQEEFELRDTAVLFTTSEDMCLRAWCVETGKRLFQTKLSAPLRNLQVVQGPTTPNGMSTHYVFGTCFHDLMCFQVRGLVELQALGEFVSSINQATCESFWAHAERRAALQRALEIVGLSGTEGERDKLAQLMALQKDIDSALTHRTAPRRVVHGSDAKPFLKTLIGRIQQRTGEDLYARIFSELRSIGLDEERLCKSLVCCPFDSEKVLDVFVAPPSSFYQRTKLSKERFIDALKGSGEPLTPFLEAYGLQALPLHQRNSWGGDATLDMFLEPRPFFYACVEKSGSLSDQEEVASDFPLIVPFYALSRLGDNTQNTRQKTVLSRGLPREAEPVYAAMTAHKKEFMLQGEMADLSALEVSSPKSPSPYVSDVGFPSTTEVRLSQDHSPQHCPASFGGRNEKEPFHATTFQCHSSYSAYVKELSAYSGQQSPQGKFELCNLGSTAPMGVPSILSGGLLSQQHTNYSPTPPPGLLDKPLSPVRKQSPRLRNIKS